MPGSSRSSMGSMTASHEGRNAPWARDWARAPRSRQGNAQRSDEVPEGCPRAALWPGRQTTMRAIKAVLGVSAVALVLGGTGAAFACDLNKALADSKAASAALSKAQADEAAAHAAYDAAVASVKRANAADQAANAEIAKALADGRAAQKDQAYAAAMGAQATAEQNAANADKARAAAEDS